MQRLADIDVAQPRHRPLVEEQGLGALPSIAEGLGETTGAEGVREGLGTHAGEPGVPLKVIRGRQTHESEAPGVVIDDATARFGLEDHVVMLRIVAGDPVETTWRPAALPLDPEPAAHAQMGDQGFAPVKIRQEVLRPAPQGGDPGARQALDETLREGKAEIRPTGLDPGETMALEDGRQSPANGLDLWKLGHGDCLAWPGPAGNRAQGGGPGFD